MPRVVIVKPHRVTHSSAMAPSHISALKVWLCSNMKSACNKWAALALSQRTHAWPSLLRSLPHYTTGGSICCRGVQPKSAGTTHPSLLPTLHMSLSAASSVQLLTGISHSAVARPAVQHSNKLHPELLRCDGHYSQSHSAAHLQALIQGHFIH
ncbi:unnamed protein product [Trypanosoma congolense IL3000]|uniref:WGS project CAEQ00000000 data, annotated contig 1370 n=1 Tax=Trypanosoma congolense (strain IL3000) TaxID=1068625 RepID=F9W5S9_TRYCI|nr:unnamed protein product [Trypanosoma congolense IL3000]